jgi:hypothetical protein
MTNRHNDILDFRYLLNRAFDRTITQDETVRLNCLFAEHPEFELEYFNFIKFQLSFRELKSIHQANSDNTLPRFDEMLHQFSEWENVAPAMKIEPAGSMAACHIPKTGETLKVNRFLFAVALASLAAFLALAAYVRLNPRFSVRQIATLTDAIDAQWVAPLHVGDRLSNKAGEYVLRKGFAKLTWDNGVTVNIEGPAQFALLTPDKMKMDTGRLFAHVPDEARGFIVKTPVPASLIWVPSSVLNSIMMVPQVFICSKGKRLWCPDQRVKAKRVNYSWPGRQNGWILPAAHRTFAGSDIVCSKHQFCQSPCVAGAQKN